MISELVRTDRPGLVEYDPVARGKALERDRETPKVCSLFLLDITDSAEEHTAVCDISLKRQKAYNTAIQKIRDIISIPPSDQEIADQSNRLRRISNLAGMLVAFMSSPTLGSKEDGHGFSVLADLYAPNRVVIHVPRDAQDLPQYPFMQTDHKAITRERAGEHWVANEFILARVIAPAMPSNQFDLDFLEDNNDIFNREAHVTLRPMLRSSLMIEPAISRL